MSIARQPLSEKQRHWYDVAFVGCAVCGLICVALLAARANLEHAHLAVTDIKKAYEPDEFPVDQPMRANVWLKNVGPASAKVLSHYARTYIRDDLAIPSQQSAADEFEKWMDTNPPKGSGEFLPSEQQLWFTADGPILSPEDQQNLVYGRRVFYVLSDVIFEDDFGKHEFKNCQIVQPLHSNEQPAFAICKVFNGEYIKWFTKEN